MIYKTEAGEREIRRRYEQALAGWPVPAERRQVPTREGDTFVLVCGPDDAPPLVLLHGSGSNATKRPFSMTAIEPQRETHRAQYVGIRSVDCVSVDIVMPPSEHGRSVSISAPNRRFV